ncbi:hypothetical protein [Ovoidimarina sediminis]|uniref:hypothetical protein n=1 Tax=Ovoidimarina sediminis TaxID=3079856 RepID=UPI00290BDCF1|nr:hypothetical protein [Rhodophyticola sp. MJ-SS7]MDU8942782.1 hypothetical protein [Rhodophyticola sp. MJ-SS7]
MTHHDLIHTFHLPRAAGQTALHDLARVLALLVLFLAVGIAAGFAVEIPADTTLPDWHGNVAVSGEGG